MNVEKKSFLEVMMNMNLINDVSHCKIREARNLRELCDNGHKLT